MSDELIDLPEGWETATVDEVIEIIDYRGRTPPFSPDGIPHLRSSNIKDGKVVWEKLAYVSEDTYQEYMTRGLPKKGDILFTTEAPLGEVALAPDQRFSLAQRMMVLRPNQHLLFSHFLLYQIKNEAFQKKLKHTGTGSTVTGVSSRNFRPLEIVIPPIAEQKRIVAKIEELRSRTQKAREALEAIPEMCDRFRQSVLAAAFRGDLTIDWREENLDIEPAEVLLERIRRERRKQWEASELKRMVGKEQKNDKWKEKYKEPHSLEAEKSFNCPNNWSWVRAEEVCDFITKGTTPAASKMSEESGDIPFIKVYNLTTCGKLDFSVNSTFTPKEIYHKELARSKVYPGDILMNIVGPPLGKVSVVPDIYPEWNINQAIAVYRPLTGVDKRFLCYCLLCSEILISAVMAAKATAGQFNLTLEICRDLPLPIPPNPEQIEIVRRIEDCLEIIDRIHQQYEAAKARLEKLDRAILAKAFRGELVPQDPDDEPASVLLDRIRQERSEVSDQKSTKRKR